MVMINTPPNEVRNFVHKRIGRAVKGFVTSGFNPVSALGGFLQPTDVGGARKTSSQPARSMKFGNIQTPLAQMVRTMSWPNVAARLGTTVAEAKARWDREKVGLPTASVGRNIAQRPGGPCPGLFSVVGPNGTCIDLTALPPGGDPALTPQFGGAGGSVMGRYGAALSPGSRMIDRAECLRGMVLGDDGLCYNRSQITNKERMWPRGRRPLLTGGDMRAISTAARAGKRLEGATKRLQKIGLMKKPAPRRIKSGPTEHHHHS